MRLMIACAAAALLSTALPVDTARAAQVPPTATAPSDRKLELTRRYIELMMSDQFETALGQMIGDESMRDANVSAMPDEDRRFLVDLTTELVTDMVPQMIAEMAPVYASVFTEEELEALLGFYDTPMGRSIAAKTVQVMPEANRAVMAVVPRMLEKMAMRMCQHYRCTPEQLQEMRRGMLEGAGLEQSADRK